MIPSEPELLGLSAWIAFYTVLSKKLEGIWNEKEPGAYKLPFEMGRVVTRKGRTTLLYWYAVLCPC